MTLDFSPYSSSKKLFFQTYFLSWFTFFLLIYSIFFCDKKEDIFFVREYIYFCGIVVFITFVWLNFILLKSKMSNNNKTTKYKKEKKDRTEDIN